MKTILHAQKFDVVLQRLAHQLLENHTDFSNSVIIGLQPRGIYLSNRIVQYLEKQLKKNIQYGKLDITFYRDDFANELHEANNTEIDFTLENKRVILIDDVLFTGRTIRSALDAIVDFGRPASVELLTLIDRRFSRELPIQANYTGLVIDSIFSQKVKVLWKEKDQKDEVILIDN